MLRSNQTSPPTSAHQSENGVKQQRLVEHVDEEVLGKLLQIGADWRNWQVLVHVFSSRVLLIENFEYKRRQVFAEDVCHTKSSIASEFSALFGINTEYHFRQGLDVQSDSVRAKTNVCPKPPHVVHFNKILRGLEPPITSCSSRGLNMRRYFNKIQLGEVVRRRAAKLQR